MIMKKIYLILAAMVGVALTSCSDESFVGSNSPNDLNDQGTQAIVFNSGTNAMTRAGEFVGATAAEKLGGMFVVEGTKGSEATDAPSSTPVFDNYLVGYTANTAGVTESNTNNWEYVGLNSTGITGRMTSDTWTALHSGATDAKSQTIKYWDYTQSQYDFIAWSTGKREAVTDAAVSGSKVKVTRINTGSTLATNGFTMTALSANDLLECYYTDITTVTKVSGNYGNPVTLTFRNMAAKIRVALYETVSGYSVKDVKFYTSDANPTAPTDLGTGTIVNATLFTMGSDVLPQSGEVLVYYPRIGSGNIGASDYNKAQVTVNATSGGATSTTQAFGALTAQYGAAEASETAGNIYLGRTLPNATFAGSKADDFYTAVIPNTNGKTLTLRLDYTLVSTDGSGEEIHVYGAKAVVPATYTKWLPNYAYTYIFKISDNSNGWTSQTYTDPKGLFPITFDAVVTSFVDANAEQTTITTVATPSITTYQQGHDQSVATNDEYSKSQTAGVSSAVKDVYVQVMDNSGATPALVTNLNDNNSLLYKITKSDADYAASEAEVMDALQNRTVVYNSTTNPFVGRNSVKLKKVVTHIKNNVTSIINGVDDQPITVEAGTAVKIDIDQLSTGTYAYVYATTVPSADEKIYQVVSISGSTAKEKNKDAKNYYEVSLKGDGTDDVKAAGSKATDGKVYFIINKKADDSFDSYTFKQTKVGDDVEGLVEKDIPTEKATGYTDSKSIFYFDVYYQNDGEYAVKVIKVVN